MIFWKLQQKPTTAPCYVISKCLGELRSWRRLKWQLQLTYRSISCTSNMAYFLSFLLVWTWSAAWLVGTLQEGWTAYSGSRLAQKAWLCMFTGDAVQQPLGSLLPRSHQLTTSHPPFPPPSPPRTRHPPPPPPPPRMGLVSSCKTGMARVYSLNHAKFYFCWSCVKVHVFDLHFVLDTAIWICFRLTRFNACVFNWFCQMRWPCSFVHNSLVLLIVRIPYFFVNYMC